MAILDPKKYIEAVKSANELQELQRANQARSDFQQFTPDLTTDFTGLKLGAQPDTRQMIRKNADGSYGTPTGLAESNTKIDPNLAPKPSAAAMQTNYNQFQNEVDRLMGKTRTTGITPNILSEFTPFGDVPISDQLIQKGFSGIPREQESFLYKRDKYGRPISMFGTEDEEQTRLGVVRYLQERDKNLPLGMTGMDDVDRYIEYGQPNMKPGAAANELQRRITKQQQEEFSATLDFTKAEREELDRVSKITNPDERNEAKKTIANKIDIRRQRDTLNKIKAMPDGPVKKAELEKLRDNLRVSVGDEMINIRQPDGSFRSMPKLVAEIEAIKNTTDPSAIAKSFENVTLSGAGSAVRAAIQKRNEIVRLANIAKSEGNRAKFEEYRGQLSALDNGIVLAQGMQGLNDIDRGDTRRLSATLSNTLGINVQIIPRDDNKFDVRQGNQTTVMDAATIKSKFRPVFDQEYRKQLKAIAFDRSNKIFETEMEIKKELVKGTLEYNKAVAVEKQKAITELKKKGFNITKTDDGTLVEKDGALGVLDMKVVKNQEGEEIEVPFVRNISIGELGSGLDVSFSVNDYMSATQ